MAKKYIVREGFTVYLMLNKPDGSGSYERPVQGGEEISLDDADAAVHLHKLEFANQKDRDAALAAEKEAKVASAAQQNPAELVAMLTAALSQMMASAPPPAAPST